MSSSLAEHDPNLRHSQLSAVKEIMLDGQWWTLPELAEQVQKMGVVNVTENGVGARVRDLRKKKFGKYTVPRKRLPSGQYAYRVDLNATAS